MLNIKVSNMQSSRGNDIANQFEIESGDKLIFQSYNSIICYIENGKVVLDEDYWDYSTTTSKYRNLFLGEKKKETLSKIKSGEYKLDKLN